MIVLNDVHKAFGANRVLEGMSLEMPEGENTVIIGGSGSGKSVLLKLIVGLLEPDAGQVTVDGQVVHDLSREELTALRGTVGYVFQFAALFDSMTVTENIRLGLARRGLKDGEVEQRIAESLAVVGLDDCRDRYPAELSGGMRKRVGIARAVALRPRYILYDEPTTGLDPVKTAAMDQLIIRTRDLGVTGIIVTHDMHSAFTIGNRIAMLHEGRIRRVGTVAEMRATDDPVVRRFIDGQPDEPPGPRGRRAVS